MNGDEQEQNWVGRVTNFMMSGLKVFHRSRYSLGAASPNPAPTPQTGPGESASASLPSSHHLLNALYGSNNAMHTDFSCPIPIHTPCRLFSQADLRVILAGSAGSQCFVVGFQSTES